MFLNLSLLRSYPPFMRRCRGNKKISYNVRKRWRGWSETFQHLRIILILSLLIFVWLKSTLAGSFSCSPGGRHSHIGFASSDRRLSLLEETSNAGLDRLNTKTIEQSTWLPFILLRTLLQYIWNTNGCNCMNQSRRKHLPNSVYKILCA